MSPQKKSKQTYQEAMSEIGWGQGNSNGHLKPKKGQRQILGGTVPKQETQKDELTEQDMRMLVSLFDPASLE